MYWTVEGLRFEPVLPSLAQSLMDARVRAVAEGLFPALPYYLSLSLLEHCMDLIESSGLYFLPLERREFIGGPPSKDGQFLLGLIGRSREVLDMAYECWARKDYARFGFMLGFPKEDVLAYCQYSEPYAQISRGGLVKANALLNPFLYCLGLRLTPYFPASLRALPDPRWLELVISETLLDILSQPLEFSVCKGTFLLRHPYFEVFGPWPRSGSWAVTWEAEDARDSGRR